MAVITIKDGPLEYLTAETIAAPHCFTTRLGGVSQGVLSSLNIAYHRGDTEENIAANYRILGNALGFSPRALVLTRQTHSDIVRVVGPADAMGLDHHNYPECDALVTNCPGTGLVIFTADCTPILFHDPVTGAVGAAHAGWRGTASGIARRTVEAMVANFGCEPKNIHAAIGPNIGKCCFETDADVPQAMLAVFGEAARPHITHTGEKYHVDLKALNALHLQSMGLTHIDIAAECTFCQSHRFWSHRVTRGQRGSQGAIIICKEVRP